MMDATRATQTLQAHGILDWATLLIGLQHGWSKRIDVTDFAEQWLSQHEKENDSRLVELAGDSGLEDSEFEQVLAAYVLAIDGQLPEKKSIEVDKWRWAYLWLLSNSKLNPDAKLDRLEELYTEFHYPSDMARCSRYYVPLAGRHDGIGLGDEPQTPLEAMDELIERLRPLK